MFRVWSLFTLLALGLPGATFASEGSQNQGTKAVTKSSAKAARKIASDPQSAAELEAALKAEHDAGVFNVMEALHRGCSEPTKNPPASPSPIWMNCAEITVHCVKPSEMPRDTGAYCRNCEMFLTESMCKVIGYTDGQRLPKEKIEDRHRNYRDHNPRGEGPFTIWGYCTAIHENEHEYDFNFGPRLRSCQTEINAYTIGIACMEHFKNKLCPGSPTGLHWTPEECDQIQADIDRSKRALQYNQCICGRTCPAGQAGCDACTAACKTAWPSEKEHCDSTNRLYCTEMNRADCP